MLSSIAALPWATLIARTILIALASSPILVLAIVLYRIFFSPLAKFPGPKLAAATGWVETYYELCHKGGGQFVFVINEWHEKYGPIVRINPHEVHISDPEFYESIYHASNPYDKPKSMELRYGLPNALFSTASHDLHKLRREPIMNLFSKKSINQFSHILYDRMDEVCERLNQDFDRVRRPIILNNLWASLTTDVITTFNFGYSYHLIKMPDFENPFANAVHILEDMVHWTTAFSTVRDAVFHLPQALVRAAVPATKYFFNLQDTVRERIIMEQERLNSPDKKNREQPTFFQTLLESDLPAKEKSLLRLVDEGSAITAAGTETTRWALTVTCFHIISNPEVYTRLRHELDSAISDPNYIPPLKELEHLPYLGACIQEGLRLAYGAVSRSPRVSPDTTLQYKDWVIPAGTPFSTQTYTMHHNESIFPDSYSYKPERWLGDARAPNGHKLNRYMVAFGRGTRVCIGMNLALAEIHVALAMFFRRFDVQLHDTDRHDVDCFWAALGPRPKTGSEGVKVLVSRRDGYRE